MKLGWKILIGVIVIGVVGGGAYIWHEQQNTDTNNSSTNESTNSAYTAESKGKNSQTNSNKTTGSTTSSTNKALWNSSKSAELSSFMSGWQKSMKQSYVSYEPGGAQYDQYRVTFPANLDGSQMPLVVGGQGDPVVSMEWSNDGTGKADYQVVAVYGRQKPSDATGLWDETVYLFAIHNGSPVVLYTQQNQGGGDNGLHFNPTDNTALESGFDKIINR